MKRKSIKWFWLLPVLIISLLAVYFGFFQNTIGVPCSIGNGIVNGVSYSYEACPGLGVSTFGGDSSRYCTLQDVQFSSDKFFAGGLFSEGGTYSCNGGGVPIFMKFVFDVSSDDITGVDFSGFIRGVAGTNNKIFGSDSSYSVGFGNTKVGGVAIHTDGRSTQSGEVGVSFSSTDFSLVKSSSGWLWRDLEGRTNVVSDVDDGKLYLYFFELGQRYAIGKTEFDFSNIVFKGLVVDSVVPPVVNPPVVVPPVVDPVVPPVDSVVSLSFWDRLKSVNDWFLNLFVMLYDSIF